MSMRKRAGYSAAAYSPEPREMAVAAGHRPRHTRWAMAAVDCFLPRPATAVGDEALRQWASAVDASMDSVSEAANGGGCNSLIDEGQSAQSHDLNKTSAARAARGSLSSVSRARALYGTGYLTGKCCRAVHGEGPAGAVTRHFSRSRRCAIRGRDYPSRL